MNCTYLDESQKMLLLSADAKKQRNGSDAWSRHREYFKRVEDADFLNQMLYVDTKAFMTSLNLTYTDKTSMACSMEVRVPFLDRELAEFVAWQVPPRLKVHGALRPTGKYILRRAMKGLLPEEIIRQPKAGFAAPLDYWLAHELREMVDDLLSTRRIHDRGYFDAQSVHKLIQDQRTGRNDCSLQIWQLLTFEIWMEQFIDKNDQDVELHPTGLNQVSPLKGRRVARM